MDLQYLRFGFAIVLNPALLNFGLIKNNNLLGVFYLLHTSAITKIINTLQYNIFLQRLIILNIDMFNNEIKQLLTKTD